MAKKPLVTQNATIAGRLDYTGRNEMGETELIVRDVMNIHSCAHGAAKVKMEDFDILSYLADRNGNAVSVNFGGPGGVTIIIVSEEEYHAP